MCLYFIAFLYKNKSPDFIRIRTYSANIFSQLFLLRYIIHASPYFVKGLRTFNVTNAFHETYPTRSRSLHIYAREQHDTILIDPILSAIKDNKRLPIDEFPCVIEQHADHHLAAFIDISPLVPDPHWCQSF